MEVLISPGSIALWLLVALLTILVVVALAAGCLALYAIVQAFREDQAKLKAKEEPDGKPHGLRKP